MVLYDYGVISTILCQITNKNQKKGNTMLQRVLFEASFLLLPMFIGAKAVPLEYQSAFGLLYGIGVGAIIGWTFLYREMREAIWRTCLIFSFLFAMRFLGNEEIITVCATLTLVTLFNVWVGNKLDLMPISLDGRLNPKNA